MALPAHFALSELIIVMISVYSLNILMRNKQYYAFFGISLIGFAALLASVRFGLDYQNELKPTHQFFTALSLIFGAPLIVLETIRRSQIFKEKTIFIFLFAALLIGAMVMVYAKNLLIIVAICWLIIGTIVATFIHRDKNLFSLLSGLSFSIIIINLLFRRVEIFDVSTSWHLYHIVTALWIFLISKVLAKNKT